MSNGGRLRATIPFSMSRCAQVFLRTPIENTRYSNDGYQENPETRIAERWNGRWSHDKRDIRSMDQARTKTLNLGVQQVIPRCKKAKRNSFARTLHHELDHVRCTTLRAVSKNGRSRWNRQHGHQETDWNERQTTKRD